MGKYCHECRMKINRLVARFPELLDKSVTIMNTRLEDWFMGVLS